MKSFYPPQRTLMGPGPTDIHPRVLQATARPIIGHLDPEFIRLMDELKTMLQQAFVTKNAMTFPVSGPGSAAMECCFTNLVEPGDEVIVGVNGVFGMRMVENVKRVRGTPIVVEHDWGKPIDPAKIDSALKEHPSAKVVAFIHAETSTGTLSDAQAIAKIAHNHDCFTIVDVVPSLGGCPVLVDEWKLDAVYAGSQKCLSCVPGIAPVTFNSRAVERIKQRTHPVQSWCLDLSLLMGYWIGDGKRAYHHTAPVNSLYSLHESLVMLHEEGLEPAWERHRQIHTVMRAGLEAMGLRYLVEEQCRLPQVNAVTVPEGVDEALVRKLLLDDYNIEIGAGLGPLAGKVWRIGLMGHTCNLQNAYNCLGALDAILTELGAKINSGVAVGAARAVSNGLTSALGQN